MSSDLKQIIMCSLIPVSVFKLTLNFSIYETHTSGNNYYNVTCGYVDDTHVTAKSSSSSHPCMVYAIK